MEEQKHVFGRMSNIFSNFCNNKLYDYFILFHYVFLIFRYGKNKLKLTVNFHIIFTIVRSSNAPVTNDHRGSDQRGSRSVKRAWQLDCEYLYTYVKFEIAKSYKRYKICKKKVLVTKFNRRNKSLISFYSYSCIHGNINLYKHPQSAMTFSFLLS